MQTCLAAMNALPLPTTRTRSYETNFSEKHDEMTQAPRDGHDDTM